MGQTHSGGALAALSSGCWDAIKRRVTRLYIVKICNDENTSFFIDMRIDGRSWGMG